MAARIPPPAPAVKAANVSVFFEINLTFDEYVDADVDEGDADANDDDDADDDCDALKYSSLPLLFMADLWCVVSSLSRYTP